MLLLATILLFVGVYSDCSAYYGDPTDVCLEMDDNFYFTSYSFGFYCVENATTGEYMIEGRTFNTSDCSGDNYIISDYGYCDDYGDDCTCGESGDCDIIYFTLSYCDTDFSDSSYSAAIIINECIEVSSDYSYQLGCSDGDLIGDSYDTDDCSGDPVDSTTSSTTTSTLFCLDYDCDTDTDTIPMTTDVGSSANKINIIAFFALAILSIFY